MHSCKLKHAFFCLSPVSSPALGNSQHYNAVSDAEIVSPIRKLSEFVWPLCPVSVITYTVSSGTLNSSIPYHTGPAFSAHPKWNHNGKLKIISSNTRIRQSKMYTVPTWQRMTLKVERSPWVTSKVFPATAKLSAIWKNVAHVTVKSRTRRERAEWKLVLGCRPRAGSGW